MSANTSNPEARTALRSGIDVLFDPASIAVIGASERPGSRGSAIISNLRAAGYAGTIYPVNPSRTEVLGLPCYPDVGSLPAVPEVAAICVGAELVPSVLESCGSAGIRACAVIAAGFAETGTSAGRDREERLRTIAREHGIAVMGPNGTGLINRLGRVEYWQRGYDEIDTSRSGASAILQSGALVDAALHLTERHGLLLDYVISAGNETCLTAEDYVDYILTRGSPRVIGLMREGIRQPRRFLDLADRARAQDVPFVVLMVGRFERSREIALTHTGALSGSFDVLRAACERHGVVLVRDLEEWISSLLLFSQAKRPQGARIGMVSVSGGGSGMLADLAVDAGVELPAMPRHTVETMTRYASDRPVKNPLDAGGYYDNREAFSGAIGALVSDPELDAVGLCLNSYVDGDVSHQLVGPALEAHQVPGKPVAVFSYGPDEPSRPFLAWCRSYGVYPLFGATSALRSIRHWLTWTSAARADPSADAAPVAADGSFRGEDAARGLTECGIRFPRRQVIDEAAILAGLQLEFPVVLKLEHEKLAHKSDVGGVVTGLSELAEVVQAQADLLRIGSELGLEGACVAAYEEVPPGVDLILGMNRDPIFGPAILVGTGGVFVELLDDVAIDLPPITVARARSMVERLRGSRLLRGARGGRAHDVDALAAAIANFSSLAMSLPTEVASIEINPLRVLPGNGGVWALDVLVETDGGERR